MDQSQPVYLSYSVGRCIIPVFSMGFRDWNRMPITHPCCNPPKFCITIVQQLSPEKLKVMLFLFFFFGGGGGVNKVYHAQCENGELTCLLLTQGSNVSVQIHPTLLDATCYWCWLLFDDVGSIEFKRLGPFKWIKHHQHCQTIMLNAFKWVLSFSPPPPPQKKDHHHHHHHHHHLVSLLSTFWKSMQ